MMGARGPRSVALLGEAASAHRAAGDTEAEIRVLTRILHRSASDGTVFRLDELTAGGAPVETIVAMCAADNAAGRHEAALARARRLRADESKVRIVAAAALMGLGRHGEAEDVARSVLGDDEERWPAINLVARAIRSAGRDPAAFLAEHEVDEDDLELDD